MRTKLIMLVLLCAVFAIISGKLYASDTEKSDCAARADKCSIIRAMEGVAATEQRILGNGSAYKWFYFQPRAKCKAVTDPSMLLHTTKCR